MPLDRTDPCYRAVSIMLGPRGPYEDLRGELDRLVDADGEITISDRINDLPCSSTEKTRLKLAMAFWNGTVYIRLPALLQFDPVNRERVLEAFRVYLGVP